MSYLQDLERMIASAPNDAQKAILETAYWKAGGLATGPAQAAPGEYAPPGRDATTGAIRS